MPQACATSCPASSAPVAARTWWGSPVLRGVGNRRWSAPWRPNAERAARQLRAMLSTAGGRIERQPPRVLITTATAADGVAAAADAIDAHRSAAREPTHAANRARQQVRRALGELAARRAASSPEWASIVEQVASRELDPLTAAVRLPR